MIVPLAYTLDYPRACISAGVLNEHGLFAEVWDECSTCYGPVSSGGYRLMVHDADVAEAAAILNAAAPLPDPDGPESGPAASPLSLDQSLGQGVITGAWLLPLMIALFLLLYRFVLVLKGSGFLNVPLFGSFGISSWLSLSFLGAILGAFGGIVAWLVSSYKRDHPAGQVFVGLVVICLLSALLGVYVG